jgi:AcrR family transcriptional regulator
VKSTREKILEAGLRLFNERGYARAGVHDIAAEAGASIGSVYHAFEGKEAIAAAIYVDGLADYQRALLRELESERRSAEEAVRGLVRNHLRWVEGNRALARYLLTSRDPEVAGATGEALAPMNQRVFHAVEEWMETWVEAGEVQRLPLGLLHAVLLGPSQEWSRHWVAGRTKETIDEAESVLAEAAWKAVRT